MAHKPSQDNKKLTIAPCKIGKNGKVTVEEKKAFQVMLNPSSYKQNETINYNKQKTPGQVESDPAFHVINSKKLGFSIIIDGTGVVPDAPKGDIKAQIDALSDVVYKYDGKQHEPNHVRLLWGELKFFGRLESMNIDYTLFAPGGTPLRAELALSFISFLTAKEEALMTRKSSPDMTHIVIVKAGDTIPRLCYQIYGEGGYYQKVARFNDITNFRYIKPGTKLEFPPLR
jgi:nucleoid-associated protein YgaU